jgi:hypothetical protein
MRNLPSRCMPALLAFVVLSLSWACASSSASPGKVALIRVEVTPEGGGPIKSLVEEGQPLRIEEKGGRALAFRPDVHSKPTKMRVYEVLKNPGGTETEHLLDETEVEVGAAAAKPLAKTYSVRILEVIPK